MAGRVPLAELLAAMTESPVLQGAVTTTAEQPVRAAPVEERLGAGVGLGAEAMAVVGVETLGMGVAEVGSTGEGIMGRESEATAMVGVETEEAAMG